MSEDFSQDTSVTEPIEVPGRNAFSVENRAGADSASGRNSFIAWGARTDVGLVRGHNEDSFLLRTPLFAVSDGMGGHAAGEVASSIAVQTIGDKAPGNADDALLGAAIEAANAAVIKGAEEGIGKQGMGCTASAVLIEGSEMAVAHVGDSRVYLLHEGTLVRVTRDHSFVEELVDAGEITPDEARVHPSRSVITRALGSDPDMYADHFSLEVSNGDRIILCSDGLSSMIDDAEIESLAVSSATPQSAADNLVAAALAAGGTDNVTVVVVDILNDGIADAHRRALLKKASRVVAGIVAVILLGIAAFSMFMHDEWYLADNNGTVAIYRGVNESILGFQLSELVSTTSVEVRDLPATVRDQLEEGIRFANEEGARAAVESYRDQIDSDKTRAAETASDARSDGDPTGETVNPTEEIVQTGEVPPDATAASPTADATAAAEQPAEAEAEAAAEGGGA